MMKENLLKTFPQSSTPWELLVEHPPSLRTKLERGLENWAPLS